MIQTRVLIVEDELVAMRATQRLLSKSPEVLCVGCATDGRSAVEKILELQPDLVFLDIGIPEMDAFGVIQTIGLKKMPAVVFVTAYDKYAIRAFEVHAVDYLLKPIEESRFAEALIHALNHLRVLNSTVGTKAGRELELIREQLLGARLPVRTGGSTIFVEISKIEYLEAVGNYVRLHTSEQQYLTRETLTKLEKRLESYDFVRIHRSTIINRNCLVKLTPWFTGEYAVTMKSGKELTLSRKFRGLLPGLLGSC